jgi:cyanophycin synthetase
MFVGDHRIFEGDMSGPDSARIVLRNPAIESAVLEIGHDGFLRSGLGYDHADVAAITGIGHDDSELPGITTREELARLSTVVANSVRPGGQIVLNADDEACVEIGRRSSQEVVYFSLHSNNPVAERHVEAGGKAIVFRGRAGNCGLFLLDAGKTSLLLEEEISVMSDKRDLSSAVSLLAASSVAVALNIDNRSIRQGFRSFGTAAVA